MHNLKTKKLLVFGTGAVGGYYGGMLVKAGFDVTFVARGENFKVLNQNGLTLIREDKKEIIPIKVFDDSKGLGIFDYIFICVKSKDTKAAAEKIKNNLKETSCVVSLQNGVENEDIISGIVGEKHVLAGLTFIASKVIEPGVIYQFGRRGCMIGELEGKSTERVLELQRIMHMAEIECEISENMRGELWNKLVWNTAFNSLSVLTGKTVDKLLEEDFDLVKNIMSEVRDVAFALGINIRPDTVEFNIMRSKGLVGFKTSMLQDYEAGKSLELEELVGVVVRKGKELNVPVPTVEKAYNEIKKKSSLISKIRV